MLKHIKTSGKDPCCNRTFRSGATQGILLSEDQLLKTFEYPSGLAEVSPTSPPAPSQFCLNLFDGQEATLNSQDSHQAGNGRESDDATYPKMLVGEA
jgi:hypothetical protein